MGEGMRISIAALALASVAACDLGGVRDPGPPEDWKLGPVQPGDTLVLPANPCPDGTVSIGRAFEKDELYGIELGQTPVDFADALRLEIPVDAPPGDYYYLFHCLSPGIMLLGLQWEVQVIARSS
jgi:hypothetical protein